MISNVAPLPSPPSSSLLSRAKRLGVGALIAVTPCASMVAAQLTLDYSASSNFSSSGWFTGTRDDSKANGFIIADGFKLWGSDSRTDGMFWRYDRDGNLEAGSDTTGLAFVWGGKITGGTTAEDKLTAPFEFSFSFTDNDGLNSTYLSARLEMGVGQYEYTPYTTDGTNPSMPSQASYYSKDSWEKSYYEAGTYEETGEISIDLPEVDASTDVYWWTLLTINWSSEYARYWSPIGQLSGDTLNVTIPQNSIDVTYVPSLSTPPTSSVPDAGSTAALLGLAMAGMLALRRKTQA